MDGEFWQQGDVNLAQVTAEINAVKAIFTPASADGINIPVGTAKGHKADFHGAIFSCGLLK
jgi:hypothetical protein